MIRLRYIIPLLLVPLVLAMPAQAAEYPTRPVTSLGPFGAGGGADTMLRAIASVIKPHLGQPLVHVNKAGGGSTIAANVVAKGKSDGYTIVTLVSPGAILRPCRARSHLPSPDDGAAEQGWHQVA